MAGITAIIKKIESFLPQVMAVDRLAAQREIRYLKRKSDKFKLDQKLLTRINRLENRLQASVQKRNRRKESLPKLRYNEELPIFSKKDEIIQAVARRQVIVVSGETGSGKTTQLPKYCLAAGRGIDGIIGCTQPRRIAATTVARRIAEELGQEFAHAVGYKIRFRDRTARDGYIKMMTDGILLAETQSDRNLSAYDTIIVDEAHERSLNIDFILGILRTLIVKRNDLKLIITSATIDTQKFSKAFDNAPVIEVSGRMYPVEIQYPEPQFDPAQENEPTHVEMAAEAVKRVLRQSRGGDMLVFMPTEQDIRDTCELISAENLRGARVMPLFARLSTAEQSRVFARQAERKIIVATNVAETSITIPGIKYVIDSGLARISRYSPRTRTTSLPVIPISRSSCDQRKGRCGRVQNGICIRLFPADDYETRPQYTPPEILRANLADVILRMISLKLGDISQFPFIDRPDLKSIKDGFDLLFELGAIEQRAKGRVLNSISEIRNSERKRDAENIVVGLSDHKSQKTIRLTEKGRLMAGIPLDPRLSRMLIEAKKEDCLEEMSIIVAALSIQDPRERPVERAREADRVHATFHDSQSDFVTLLNIWHRYHRHQQQVKSNNQMKRFCREHFLSYMRMREWRDIHHQISEMMKEYGFRNAKGGLRPLRAVVSIYEPEAAGATWAYAPEGSGKAEVRKGISKFEAIHKSILSGFLSNIAQKKQDNIYRAAKGREVMIFPGSGLFNKAKNWIVAEEMMETSRLFARTVANIDSDWLEDLGGDLCRRTYLTPHWEKNRGEVVASEQVSLFGLIIVPDRKVSYGKVNPTEASRIFIREALINADVKRPFGFMKYNRQLIDEIKDIENRLRRRDLLVDEAAMFEFYRQRLPEIYDVRSLTKYLKQKGNDRFLRMQKDTLLQYRPDNGELNQYPSQLNLDRHVLECSYRFEPGKEDDGVTVNVPSALAQSVPPEAMDWLVPGLFPEKIEVLIKALPKAYRKKLVPIKNTVAIIVREMQERPTSLVSALGDFIYRRFGIDIPAAAWALNSLPDYLKMRISITAPDGNVLRAGRDAALLRGHVGDRVNSDEFEAARKNWEKKGIRRWDFGDLPELVSDTAKTKARWVAYPALEPDSATPKTVNLRLFRGRDKSLAAHRAGVAALYAIHFAKNLKFLKRQLVLPAGLRSSTDYFGGAKKLIQQLYDRVLDELFAKNIRSEKAFYAHAECVAAKISPTGQDWLDKTIPVLTAYHEARSRMYDLQQANRTNRMAVSFLEELTRELERLVPQNFIAIYDILRLDHLPRYIQAAAIRARRAIVDFEKDRAKSEEIKKFSDGLNHLLKELSPAVSDEKRQAIEAFFWLLEEFKVSVFAQELKTAVPISAKRLDKKLKEIGRMV